MNNKTRQLQRHNLDRMTQTAKILGIKLTNAEVGTELYTCWVDRVEDAANAFKAGRLDRALEIIEDANRYAI